MATGISFSGLSSGIDTDSIISALTQAETARKTALQKKQNTLKLRQTAYTTLKTGLTAVSRAAGALNSPSAFNTLKASTGDEAVATIATTSAAAPGTYNLNVEQLARANKLGSNAQADVTSALGKSGAASINGKAFKIAANDSLTDIAKKINSLGSGATASVVDGGSGRAYITLAAGSTGAANGLLLADLDGTALQDLGIVASGATVRQTVGGKAVGNTFASKTDSLQSLLGATGLSGSTISIDGTTVAVDPATDSLDSLAAKINAAGGDASVQADTKDGATVYRLQIGGTAISESGGLLRGLGILKSAAGNELVPAQDAKFKLDGVELTSTTNAVTSVIPGATLTLKKEAATTIDLTKDDAAVKKNVDTLVSTVNDLLTTIGAQSTFDPKTYSTGVLFGDSVARNVKDSVRGLLFTDAPGATGTIKNLASIGFGLDKDGKVTLDDATFSKAMASDPEGVSALFQAVGKGSDQNLRYVSATSTAQASSTGGYPVEITQVATRGSYAAGKAQTGTRTIAETLTFRGSAFGASGIAVDLEAGTDLAATVSKINGDGRLKDLVVASVEDGKLRIDSKRYGAAGNFSLTSNADSTNDNSGVGVGGEGVAVLGLDVAGTINGEEATGSGQFLTGKTGNARTDGLQIQYTGTATGAIGAVAYSRGVASRMIDLITGFNDATKGSLVTSDKSLQTQIDGLDTDMATIDTRLETKKAELAKRFAAMEDAISKLKANEGSLSSLWASSSNN